MILAIDLDCVCSLCFQYLVRSAFCCCRMKSYLFSFVVPVLNKNHRFNLCISICCPLPARWLIQKFNKNWNTKCFEGKNFNRHHNNVIFSFQVIDILPTVNLVDFFLEHSKISKIIQNITSIYSKSIRNEPCQNALLCLVWFSFIFCLRCSPWLLDKFLK